MKKSHSNKNKIGFWGFPDPQIINNLKNQYPNAQWVDLDIDFGYPDTKILPDAYCKIIKNIINNAVGMKDNLITIIGTTGKDKCDSGWFAHKLLLDMGFNMIESRYEITGNQKPLAICTSNLPLYDKVNTIMNNLSPSSACSGNYTQCAPAFGFWGVPPNDLEVLKLFPDNTHVYGWTRCVEAGTPADLDLEMHIDPDIPTVFYAQAFCSKCQLAKYLADKYNGLYVDIDDYASNSVRAKIEAFLRLR